MHPRLRYTLYGLILFFASVGFLFTIVFIGMQFGAFNVRGSISDRNNHFLKNASTTVAIDAVCTDHQKKLCDWRETPQWAVVEGGLLKDQAIIARVAQETGVSPRFVAALVIPEQIRFFTAERETFKKYFEPLKILGSLSQFSLGVSGIKQETAATIERYAKDPTSPFYPGESYAALIAYADSSDHDGQLYARLTDSHNHYYSYLYTALFIKEVSMQWERAGYSILEHPGALVTLFNIGFEKSEPKQSPATAGAPIAVGGTTYLFGELGEEFYISDALLSEFPK